MKSNLYLLDTHCLIWFQGNNPKIPAGVMDKVRNPDNIILFSQISLFEITIKQTIGKLPDFHVNTEEIYHQAIFDGFTFQNIQNQHIYSYNKLPLSEDHRDPFDRLLIATAIEEKAIILSADYKFSLYSDIIDLYWE